MKIINLSHYTINNYILNNIPILFLHCSKLEKEQESEIQKEMDLNGSSSNEIQSPRNNSIRSVSGAIPKRSSLKKSSNGNRKVIG